MAHLVRSGMYSYMFDILRCLTSRFTSWFGTRTQTCEHPTLWSFKNYNLPCALIVFESTECGTKYYKKPLVEGSNTNFKIKNPPCWIAPIFQAKFWFLVWIVYAKNGENCGVSIAKVTHRRVRANSYILNSVDVHMR